MARLVADPGRYLPENLADTQWFSDALCEEGATVTEFMMSLQARSNLG